MKNLLLAVLLLAPAAYASDVLPVADAERAVPVPPAAARPFAVAPISRDELLNGLKLAAVESARLPVVALELALPFGGSALDPQGREGLAGLTASLLTEGAGGRDADAFSDAVDDLGASVSVVAGADALIVKVFARKENLDAVVALVADLVRRPTLPAESLERLRAETIAGLTAKKGEPEALAGRRLNARLFENHPYGRSADETSVAAVTQNDVAAAAARLADPRGARLSSAGDLSVTELRALAERHFGDWTAAGALPALPAVKGAPVAGRAAGAPQAAAGLGIDLIDLPGSEQSAIRFGQLSITRDHPDFYALRLMMEVLGGGQGRLHRNIREEKGWAYGAYAFLAPRRAGGELSGETDVQTDRTADAVREIYAELDRIRTVLVPASELEKAKAYAAGGLLRRQQRVQDVAAQTTAAELAGLPPGELAQYRDKLLAVTAEQVLATAQRHLLPASVHVVIAGDAEKVYESLTSIAPVTVYGADGAVKPAPVKKPAST